MNNDKAQQVLRKIIGHIEHTLEYCQGQTFDSFMENRMLQEACIFNILQVGELSKVGLAQEFTDAHPQIAWNQMYGMRNRMVHDYEGLRLKTVWLTISEDFPTL
ncbi:MAG: HepT-like ribonuclease domain-containing protein, partial [Clostridia bacterium]